MRRGPAANAVARVSRPAPAAEKGRARRLRRRTCREAAGARAAVCLLSQASRAAPPLRRMACKEPEGAARLCLVRGAARGTRQRRLAELARAVPGPVVLRGGQVLGKEEGPRGVPRVLAMECPPATRPRAAAR